MKVEGPGNVGGAGKAGKAKPSADGSFSKFLSSTGSAEEVSGVSGISKLSAVNFIQALDGDERSRKRQMVDDGNDLLDELLKIRDSLLMGNVSADRLRGIQQKLDKIEANCDDDSLNEIIEEIKIRAAVELAKLGF